MKVEVQPNSHQLRSYQMSHSTVKRVLGFFFTCFVVNKITFQQLKRVIIQSSLLILKRICNRNMAVASVHVTKEVFHVRLSWLYSVLDQNKTRSKQLLSIKWNYLFNLHHTNFSLNWGKVTWLHFLINTSFTNPTNCAWIFTLLHFISTQLNDA